MDKFIFTDDGSSAEVHVIDDETDLVGNAVGNDLASTDDTAGGLGGGGLGLDQQVTGNELAHVPGFRDGFPFLVLLFGGGLKLRYDNNMVRNISYN